MGSSSKQCAHGVPPIDPKEKADYSKGLKDLLKRVTEYLEKGSKNVGKKAAEKWQKDWPNLITEQMMALLAATGTRMLLAGDDRARFVVQAFAEAIGVLEKQVKGASTVNEELKTTVDKVTGVPKASKRNLTNFYINRIPCKCLGEVDDKPSEEEEEEDDDEEVSEEEEEQDDDEAAEEEFGTCTYNGCNASKLLTELSACAGCNVATYCSVDCQRNDWPRHSKECQRLNLERQQRIWALKENADGGDDDSADYSGSSQYDDDEDVSDSEDASSSSVEKPKKKSKDKDGKKKGKDKKGKEKDKVKKSKSEKGDKKKKKEKKSKETKNRAVQV